jgi:hypothetical protein
VIGLFFGIMGQRKDMDGKEKKLMVK